MAGIRSGNTRPELFVRKLLHAAGYRFRLATKIGRIKPDIVLPKWKTAIFIHGCFWHGHEPCHLYRLPKSNAEFWSAKVGANRERDTRALHEILNAGWNVITVWECAAKGRRKLTNDQLISQLDRAIRMRKGASEIPGFTDNKPVHLRQ
jgi:DNA mismatch endonuclease, patch repair protein